MDRGYTAVCIALSTGLCRTSVWGKVGFNDAVGDNADVSSGSTNVIDSQIISGINSERVLVFLVKAKDSPKNAKPARYTRAKP